MASYRIFFYKTEVLSFSKQYQNLDSSDFTCIHQLVEVTYSAVLGGVVEVVSSKPAVDHKYFSSFTGIVELLYLFISSFMLNLY